MVIRIFCPSCYSVSSPVIMCPGPGANRGAARWDVLRRWGEIQNGLALADKKHGNKVVSVGADAWGMDFVLLNKQEEMFGLPYHYDVTYSL